MPDPEVSASAAPLRISRKCPACEEEDNKKLQLKLAGLGEPAAHEAPPIAHEVLRSSGQPLDATTRSFFEPRFRYDFSDVRVHADRRAAESAASIGALAYTAGSNIAFASGRYDPATPSGKSLLAHELTHVVQQRSRPSLIQRDDGSPAAMTLEDRATRPSSKAIIRALNRVDPEAAGGVGDFPEAFRILNGLAMFDILATLDELNNLGELQLLRDHINDAVGVDRPRIKVGIVAVAERKTVIQKGWPPAQGQALAALPPEQQSDVIRFLGATPRTQAREPQGGLTEEEQAVLIGVLVGVAVIGGAVILIASAGSATPLLAGTIIALEAASGGAAVTELAAGTTVALEIVAGSTAAAAEEAAAVTIITTATAETVAPAALSTVAPAAAQLTIASSSSAASAAAAATTAITAGAAATTLSSDTTTKEDGKKRTSIPCRSEEQLCASQLGLLNEGIKESAEIRFMKNLEKYSESRDPLKSYCLHKDQQRQDANQYGLACAKNAEWCIVQACSRDGELLGIILGSKNPHSGGKHAEIRALETLELELLALPLERRTGGKLFSACIKIACEECGPKLADFSIKFLPGGPPPRSIDCGYGGEPLVSVGEIYYEMVVADKCSGGGSELP